MSLFSKTKLQVYKVLSSGDTIIASIFKFLTIFSRAFIHWFLPFYVIEQSIYCGLYLTPLINYGYWHRTYQIYGKLCFYLNS